MEEQVINILLDIKSDIGGLKKGQEELKEDVAILKEGQQRLEGRMDKLDGRMDALEADVSDIKDDMFDLKTTVNALAEGLLETSREIKQIKGKAVHA